MKISKKKQQEFAAFELGLRYGVHNSWRENLNTDDCNSYAKGYTTSDDASYQLATMMSDGLFRETDHKFERKFYGAKLWQKALERRC